MRKRDNNGKGQTHDHRKIPLTLLSVSQHPSGLVWKAERHEVIFLSW